MKNEEIALLTISRLKSRSEVLAHVAKYVMTVDSFSYDDICNEFDISKSVSYNRINVLKRKGFVFEYLTRNPVSGGTFRLIDCREWIPKQRKSPTLLEESKIKIKFVDKANVQIPVIPNLWRQALGLVEPDFSQCEAI